MRAMQAAVVVAVLSVASTANAQLFPPPPPITVPIPLTISGNQARGTIALPGGIGADLTITFESVVGLTPTSLEASATLVNPLDPALLARLPRLLRVPITLPLLVHVGPTESSLLSFTGVYTISFHTHALKLDPLRPLSLVKSPDGGPFRDITRSEGIGSYRDDGSGGDFSDFLIGLDLRPIDAVVSGKFDDLDQILDESAGAMLPGTFSALQTILAQARAFHQSGDFAAAADQIREFSDVVKAHSGPEIPDVWQANGPPGANVAGRLRSAADTLRFSLLRKANS